MSDNDKLALPGEHYCHDHQGNHAHYAKENCTVCKLEAELAELRKALHTIGSGMTNEFPGAPDVMNCTPADFRHQMWTWSQKVARSALGEQ